MSIDLVLQLLVNKTSEITDILAYMQKNREEAAENLPLLMARIEALQLEANELKNRLYRPEKTAEIIMHESEKSEKQQVEEEKNQQEAPILNSKLQLQRAKGEVLGENIRARCTDIQSAIGINDRFLFIRELFNNNAEAYKATLNKINTAASFSEAEQQLQFQNWDEENPVAVQFMEIVKRKF